MNVYNIFVDALNLFMKYVLAIFIDSHTVAEAGKTPDNLNEPIINYEDWRALQYQLDHIRGVDEWLLNDQDPSYNWSVVRHLKHDLQQARRNNNYVSVCSQIRAQASRNMCGLLSSSLYQRSQVRTKRLIHEYILEFRKCIRYIANNDSLHNNPSLEKLQVLHDLRQSLGRTTLVLQGGAMISMCHIGTVRAMLEQRVLPQIITGTATGALIAALVTSTPDDRLKDLLARNDINIEPFVRAKALTKPRTKFWKMPGLETLLRRVARYQTTGHFFNIDVLRECAKKNLGDVTFEEAYASTGRILNITIAMSDVAGTPQLLNYITAPHVVLCSAVMASIATSKKMYAPVSLFCKSRTGEIIEYYAADAKDAAPFRPSSSDYEAPLQRIGELFNVNHFIVSQTRPYILPFIRFQRLADRTRLSGALVRSCFNELLHWMKVAGKLGILPNFLQRILVDEVVPSLAEWSKMYITPNLSLSDLALVLDSPTPSSVARWTRIGEESTWPAICELKMRCAIELELDAAHDSIRRRRTSIS